MVHIKDHHEALAAAGRFSTAISSVTGQSDTVVESFVLNARDDSPLGRALSAKLSWIRTTFENGLSEAASQAGVTKQAATVGINVLRNADIDGEAVVRTAEV
ncbi:hypothetical protein [Nocardia paucivorans]|uniref:hypothetical protein n=1 Tax=Nocardia paucivorans TaxID=114259 RepID=UPI0002F5DF46|nr:hypothetical protein [Nocardia paucivorans]